MTVDTVAPLAVAVVRTPLADVRAELVKQARRPAGRLLLAVAVLLNLTFAYLIPYAGLAGAAEGAPNSGRGLASMLPEAFVGTALGGLPMFLGALALIFGVLVAGGEYGWGTWKTVLAQGPSRLSVYAAKIAVVLVGALALMVVLFAVMAGAATVVATVEGQSIRWPSLVEVLRGLGAGWLVSSMWGALGVVLAVGLRSVALPIGLGLVWVLAVQNLLGAVAAPLLPWVADLQEWLPGPAAGSLAAALGAPEGTPGVAALVGTGQAVLVVAAYLLAFCAVGGVLFHRRDID